MKRITALNVLEHYRVWLRFDDDVEGQVDFSIKPRTGVFAPWDDYEFYRQARLGEQGRNLTWPGELDFCVDALWLQLTGKQREDLFPDLRNSRSTHAHA